jgi:hypothetical protein
MSCRAALNSGRGTLLCGYQCGKMSALKQHKMTFDEQNTGVYCSLLMFPDRSRIDGTRVSSNQHVQSRTHLVVSEPLYAANSKDTKSQAHCHKKGVRGDVVPHVGCATHGGERENTKGDRAQVKVPGDRRQL